MGFYRALRLHLPPLPTPTLDCRHGWLAPDGKLYPVQDFYSVGYSDHNRVGGLLEVALRVENAEDVCLKVQDHNVIPFWGERKNPTDAQKRTAREYLERQGKRLPYWMGGDEDEYLDDEPKVATRVAEPVIRRVQAGELTRARLARRLDGD
jgi:hypothetical protein